jgi:AraC-like DNA-binding protein
MQTIRLLSDMLCVVVSLFWAVLFYFKHGQSKAFTYAWLFFIFSSVIFLSTFSDDLGFVRLSLVLNLFFPPAVILIPILFLNYLHYLTSPDSKPKQWVSIFYLVPLALFLYSGYAFYIHYPIEEIKDSFYFIIHGNLTEFQERFRIAYVAHRITWHLLVVSLAAVIIVSVYFIPVIFRSFPLQNTPKLSMVTRRFLLLLSVSYVLCIVTIVFYYTGDGKFLMRLLWSTGLFLIGYLMYKEIIFQKAVVENPKIMDSKYVILCQKLDIYFTRDSPWLNSELKLAHAATELGTNRTYLSKSLKEVLNMNFNAYANQYRIAEVKRLISDENNHHKLEDIALMSGFSAYSTFLTVFEKSEGMSPSSYMQLIASRKKIT